MSSLIAHYGSFPPDERFIPDGCHDLVEERRLEMTLSLESAGVPITPITYRLPCAFQPPDDLRAAARQCDALSGLPYVWQCCMSGYDWYFALVRRHCRHDDIGLAVSCAMRRECEMALLKRMRLLLAITGYNLGR